MPLVINGSLVEELPTDTKTLFDIYPCLKESARPLLSQAHKLIGTIGSLYVSQREYGVVTPHDKFINIVGTDSTTTCCSVVVRHSGSGVVSVGHFDGSGVQEGVSDMVTKVQQFSSLLGGHGVLEVHIAGGFLDRRGYSEDLAVQLLRSANYPIVCGISVNVKTGEIFPSTFTERGPESALRGARLLTGGSHEMLDMYETQIGVAKIEPFNYEPMRGVDLWLNEGDNFILQHLSTSPEAEPPHFVSSVKSSLLFIQQNPFPSVTVFTESRPLYFRKDEYGQWIAI